MFIYHRQLMLWGGLTQVFIGEGKEQFMYETDIPGKLLYLYMPHTVKIYKENIKQVAQLSPCNWGAQLRH